MNAKERAKSALEVFECEGGRKIVHSFTRGGLGADWDLSEVEDFIDKSEALFLASPHWQRMGHSLRVRSGSREVIFATKPVASDG